MPKEGKSPKWLGKGAKGLFDFFWPREQRSPKSLFAPPKSSFAPVRPHFAPVQEASCSQGPKDLLHPLLTTFGIFIFRALSDPRNRNHKSLAIANNNFEVASFSRRNRNEIAVLQLSSFSLLENAFFLQFTPLGFYQRAENGVLDLSWLNLAFLGCPDFPPRGPKPFKTSILGPLD